MLLSILDGISSVRVYLPKDLLSKEARQGVNQSLVEVRITFFVPVSLILFLRVKVERRFPDGIPLLDPIEDMKVVHSPYYSRKMK